MSHPKLNQLARVEQLFDEGKLDEALKLLNNCRQFERLNFQQKSHFQFLKGLILIYQNNCQELIELGEKLHKEGKDNNDNLQLVDGSFFISMGLGLGYNFIEALRRIEKDEVLVNLISNNSKDIIIPREVRINLVKSWLNLEIDNVDLSEKFLDLAFNSLQELKEIGTTFELVWFYLLKGRIMFQGKMKVDLANNYTKKALLFAKEIKFNHFWIAICQLNIGVFNISVGEYNKGLKYHMMSLTIFKEIKNDWYTALTLNNLGGIYSSLGDYNLAMKSLEESLLISEAISIGIEIPLGNLIEIALEIDDIELAQQYYNRLKILYNQKKDGNIVLIYPFERALILKRSSRIRDKAKSEKLLKKIIETETIWFEVIQNSIIHLCDLLISEYHLNNNKEVLDEINHYIAKLLTMAEKQRSYSVFCKAFILKAKLALLHLDVKVARRFLIQAQKIAEKYGIKHLAMKISHEHDELLKQIKMWENLKDSGASISEIWKLAGLREQMENMVKKRMIEVPKLSEEEPITILIITEGGTPLFFHSFREDQSFESHLFSGFLSTIDYFIREMFSEGLDRAIFSDYTLLMRSTPPFFITYIYKGDSYYANQKINYFIDTIQEEEQIWQNLQKYFQLNQTIHLEDIPSLEPLIEDIFIKKIIY